MVSIPTLVCSASEPLPSPLFEASLRQSTARMNNSDETLSTPVVESRLEDKSTDAGAIVGSCIYELLCAEGNSDTLQQFGLAAGVLRRRSECTGPSACETVFISGSGSVRLFWKFVGCDTAGHPEVPPFPFTLTSCDELPTLEGYTTCRSATCMYAMTCGPQPSCPGYFIPTMTCGGPTCSPGVTCSGNTCSPAPTCVPFDQTCMNYGTCSGSPTCVGMASCSQTCAGTATCVHTCLDVYSCPLVSTCPGATTCEGTTTCMGSACGPTVSHTCAPGPTCKNVTCEGTSTCPNLATCETYPTCTENHTCAGQATCSVSQTCQIQTCEGQSTCRTMVTCSGATCNISTCAGLATCVGVATCNAYAGCLLCSCPKQGDLDGNGSYDISDLLGIIRRVYFVDTPARHDANCPHSDRADLSCDGEHTILDVVLWVDKVWRRIPNAICDPCTRSGSR